MFLNRLKGRLRARWNVAVAEVEHQDLRHRTGVAAVTVGSDRRVVERLFEQIVREAERHDAQLLRYETELL